MLIPAGWLVSQATLDDCLALGSTFLYAGALGGQLRVAVVEEYLQVRRCFIAPFAGSLVGTRLSCCAWLASLGGGGVVGQVSVRSPGMERVSVTRGRRCCRR